MPVESHLKVELLLEMGKEGLNVPSVLLFRFRYLVRCYFSFLKYFPREASFRNQSKCPILSLKGDDAICIISWGEGGQELNN